MRPYRIPPSPPHQTPLRTRLADWLGARKPLGVILLMTVLVAAALALAELVAGGR